jgi:Fe2+ transport system protein FeoA
VQNPESADRDRTLVEAGVGEYVRVVRVGADADRLVRHGIRPGATLTVDQDAPLGGPRIVRVGPSRLAVARSLATCIVVRRIAR